MSMRVKHLYINNNNPTILLSSKYIHWMSPKRGHRYINNGNVTIQISKILNVQV